MKEYHVDVSSCCWSCSGGSSDGPRDIGAPANPGKMAFNVESVALASGGNHSLEVSEGPPMWKRSALSEVPEGRQSSKRELLRLAEASIYLRGRLIRLITMPAD